MNYKLCYKIIKGNKQEINSLNKYKFLCLLSHYKSYQIHKSGSNSWTVLRLVTYSQSIVIFLAMKVLEYIHKTVWWNILKWNKQHIYLSKTTLSTTRTQFAISRGIFLFLKIAKKTLRWPLIISRQSTGWYVIIIKKCAYRFQNKLYCFKIIARWNKRCAPCEPNFASLLFRKWCKSCV